MWVGIPAGSVLVSALCFDGVTQHAFSDGDLSVQMARITEEVRLQRHWVKPDWAFVENDEPEPPLAECLELLELGVPGSYALRTWRRVHDPLQD